MADTHWDTVRFTFGMMPMAAAMLAAILLFRTGVTRLSVIAAVSACLLTTISVLIVGARGPQVSW